MKQWVRSINKFAEFWIILNSYLFLFLHLVDVFCIFAFASLISIPVGITSSVVRLKICVITARIKKYKEKAT